MRHCRIVLLALLVLPVIFLAATSAFGATESGYLSGPGASYTFTVNAGSVTYLEVTFSYPKGSVDFWVKVVGQDGRTVLGNFDLDNGEIIQLQGGGTFYLTVYSNRGAGYWSAAWGGEADRARQERVTSTPTRPTGDLVGPGRYVQLVDLCTQQLSRGPLHLPEGLGGFLGRSSWARTATRSSGTLTSTTERLSSSRAAAPST